jgi:hypothetical protein
MKDLSNKEVVHIKKDGLEYIQFRKLLEYKEVKHCFTLKSLDFAGNASYQEKKTEVENKKVVNIQKPQAQQQRKETKYSGDDDF